VGALLTPGADRNRVIVDQQCRWKKKGNEASASIHADRHGAFDNFTVKQLGRVNHVRRFKTVFARSYALINALSRKYYTLNNLRICVCDQIILLYFKFVLKTKRDSFKSPK